ncbi:MAG: class I SAM-dependent methyltransferase [Planctomycetes bacterium]|nr:class I SAM-dependent methyltransferase [Planctomycetota bacterium]
MHLSAPHTADLRQPIAWDECACLLCGGARHTPILEAVDSLGEMRFLIVRCERCGLAFTNPRPDRDSIDRFYPDDYACHRIERQPLAKRDGSVALPKHGLARLLDFGCGSGAFLARMNAQGWNVVGLDRSENAVKRVREHFGLTAHVGSLPSPYWTSNCFEAVTMWQSLEHVHDPLGVLRAAYRLLTPGGRLLVAVPNVDGWAARWFGAHWYGLDLPRHLTHFTPTTLHLMLTLAGFARIDMRQERKSSWIRHSAGMTPPGDWMARAMRTRFGSGLAGWAALAFNAAESIFAVATK